MKKKRPLTGFSLIEILIGLSILAIGYLMILGVFPVSMSSVKHGKDILFATHAAQQQMENAIYRNFTDYGLSISNSTATLTSIVNNQTTTTNFTYSVTFNPDTQAGTSSATTKNIIVMIYVTNKPERYVKLETDVAREE